MDVISKHENDLLNYTMKKMLEIEGIQIYNKNTETPLITFNIDGVHPHDAASVLDQNNVNVRAGHHCAQLVVQLLDVTSTLRASFAIYNTYEDCDKLIEAIIIARDFFEGFR